MNKSKPRSDYFAYRRRNSKVRVTSPCLNINNPTHAWSVIENSQQFLPVPTFEAGSPRPDSTRIVCMSDTHGKHRQVFVPKCDVLIHSGDFTKMGEANIVQDLGNFFRELKETGQVKEIICIAGNHDILFQTDTYRSNWGTLHGSGGRAKSSILQRSDIEKMKETFNESCVYLEDESHIHSDSGIQFYGSPWTPTYGHCWAFMIDRSDIHSIWDEIPNSTDVLVTHGPPLGRGDKCLRNVRAGCLELLRHVQTRVRPRLHVYGHIHEDAGCSFDGNTLYVNASNCSIRYRAEQPCAVIDVPHDVNEQAKVVLPRCSMNGEEVILWLKSKGYEKILPFFEGMQPLLGGESLVQHHLVVDEVARMLRMNPYEKEERIELSTALIHLQSESY